jgi:ABC-type glycerol-3-phosphate transport system substrate-binding protein
VTGSISAAHKADLVPGAMDAVSYKGRIYGLPKFFSIRTFYYNKRMFREAGVDPTRAPRTWDEFVQMARKVTNPSKGQYGVLHNYGSKVSLLIDFQEHLILTGGRMFDDKDRILKTLALCCRGEVAVTHSNRLRPEGSAVRHEQVKCNNCQWPNNRGGTR